VLSFLRSMYSLFVISIQVHLVKLEANIAY
jgi:hypothetical protein